MRRVEATPTATIVPVPKLTALDAALDVLERLGVGADEYAFGIRGAELDA